MPITFRLRLDDYLADWFVHDCGGGNPLCLPRNCVESLLLTETLQPRRLAPARAGFNEPPGVDVVIPEFRLKPAEYYNYLPPAAHNLLVSIIRGRFDVDMWQFFHTLEQAAGIVDRQELIYAFMEARGISPTEKNWNAIAKRYQRKVNSYRMAKLRKARKNEEKSL